MLLSSENRKSLSVFFSICQIVSNKRVNKVFLGMFSVLFSCGLKDFRSRTIQQLFLNSIFLY